MCGTCFRKYVDSITLMATEIGRAYPPHTFNASHLYLLDHIGRPIKAMFDLRALENILQIFVFVRVKPAVVRNSYRSKAKFGGDNRWYDTVGEFLLEATSVVARALATATLHIKCAANR